MVRVGKLKDNVYQIRVIDKGTRHFHGSIFPVAEGASYNCYLVLDEQITLIDTVEEKYFPEVFEAVKDILAGKKIDNLIVNHVEPDHSGSFECFTREFPKAKVYTSKAGVRGMQRNYFDEHEYNEVGFGDEIKTGKYTLAFAETPLVHWPDNMWTFLKEEKLLFSNDAFGQLLVDDVLYDEEIDKERVLKFSREYYANIVWPCNKNVEDVLNKLPEINWDFDMIAPSHGVVIKGYLPDMVQQYQNFVKAETKKDKVLIVYETVWGNTHKMADIIEKELLAEGFDVKKYHIFESRVSEIIDEMIDTEFLFIGTSNHNNCVLPPVADFVERLMSSRFYDRKAIVFGSYGWAGIMPFKDLEERMEKANFEIAADSITLNYKPNDEDKKNIRKIVANLRLK